MTSLFLHAPLAWAALALAAIPILIHLINRRRFRRIDWAAMEFLLDALKRNRRRLKIEQLLLLALRMLLLVIAAFALARPFLSDRGFSWVSSALRSEDKIFVIDDSSSTAKREGSRSVLDREVEAMGVQVRAIAERGGGDRVTVLRASRYQNPIVRGVFLDRERALALERSLARVAPADTRFAPARVLDGLRELLASEESEASGRPRSINILTDLRTIDWTDGRGGPDEALKRAFASLRGREDAPTRIVILDAASDETANAAITSVTVEGGRPVQDIPVDLAVEVRNFGPAPLGGLSLRLRAERASAAWGSGDQSISIPGPAIADLEPGATSRSTVPFTFRAPGFWGIHVELSGTRDSLATDDTFSTVLEVVPATEVLIVSGEPSGEAFRGEADFLAMALAPPGDVPSGIHPTVVTEDSLPRGELSAEALVFVANLHSFPADFLAPLGRYVRAGGTLVIFLGDQVDAALLSRDLGSADPKAANPAPERGLLPARLGDIRGSPEAPLRLRLDFEHPWLRGLKDIDSLVGLIRFYRYFALDPEPESQVLARFTDGEASPAILERTVGKGRVILFASSADDEWNDWPSNQTYLPFLLELVKGVLSSRTFAADPVAGMPLELAIDIASYAREARIRLPGYPGEPERVLSAAPPPEPPSEAAPPTDGGRASVPEASLFRLTIDDTTRAGAYAFGLKRKGGEDEWRLAAVRRDPLESDLTRISPAKLRELYPEAELTVVREASAFSEAGRGNFEASYVLIWAFLAILFLEGFLAMYFAHHRHSAGGVDPRSHGGGTP